MSFFTLVGVEFKKIRRSKIFFLLAAAAVILWIPSRLYGNGVVYVPRKYGSGNGSFKPDRTGE